MPEQLKEDLIRTASLIGFEEERRYYEKRWSLSTKKNLSSENGELIIFWETGLGPVKSQTYYGFTLLPGSGGVATVYNKELNLTLPIPMSASGEGNKFSNIETFQLAFPKYESRLPLYTHGKVRFTQGEVAFEKVQDFNQLAKENLKDRGLRELSQAALRVAAKKTSEHIVRKQNQDLGAILGLINAFTERADTRNWQSLPAEIQYARIPLKKGENIIRIELFGARNEKKEKEIKINGKKGLQVYSFNSLQTSSS